MKKRRVMAVLLCLAMMVSMMSVYAFAAEPSTVADEEVESRTVVGGAISFVRNKALQGKLTIEADSSGINLDYIKATVTIQKKNSSGSWSKYGSSYDIYGNAAGGVIMSTTYVDVEESGTYRVKVVFSDKRNGIVTTTSAYYSNAASL